MNLDIINKIVGLKATLAYKKNYTVSDVENITLFESAVGHLLNPKSNRNMGMSYTK